MSSSTFINELKAFPPLEFAPPEDPHELDEWLSSNPSDPANMTYLQAAFFNKPNDTEINKYFMIVNRRCAPYVDSATADNLGGRRLVTMKVNPSQFTGFNNWVIYDLEDGDSVAAFDKNSSNFVYIGDFMPGQGKLFRVAPVMQEGGTLVTDEVVSAEQTFTCKAPVFNDENDLTIEYGVTVNFLQGSYIEMDGGSFYSGDLESGTEVILTAETGNTWNGLTLIDNPRVEILNTVFEHIGVDVPTYTAVNLSNPHVLKIIESEFVNTNSNNLSVTVDYNFSTQPREITAIFNYNTFNTFGSEMVGIYCSGSSSIDLQMQWNNFTNPSSTTGINGLTLSGVSGGVVKNNTFTNFSTSVKTLNSSVDYFNNQITSSFNGFGLELTSTSNANMSGPSALVFGGNNFFYNDHNEAINLKVDNSTFEIAEGYNYFDIPQTAPVTSYHLLGYFPSPGFGEPAPIEAMYNCFKFSGEPTENPRANVTWGAFGNQIDFIFEDFDCSGAEEYEIGLIVDLGEGQFDTIYSKSGGSSGGQSGGMTNLTYPQLVNEMYLLTRKREYENLYEICEQLLQNFPDSSSTNDALSKIYFAALKTDVEGNIMSDVKTLLEQLILNNGNNSRLIEKSFYLIQKCKAALGDYSGAMSGFQQIINNNPFSYEALLASWDYSAVSLHHGSGSSGGAKSRKQDAESGEQSANEMSPSAESGTLLLLFDDRNDRYDRTTFTKEDRKVILENTKAVIEKNREKTIEKVEDLKQKSLDGDKRADKELKVLNALKESARIFKPKDNKDHFDRIKQDVTKLSKLSVGDNLTDIFNENIIPSEYSLHQNYPNPFNPSTKITFELPKDTRVTLKVFDITGREIAVLLNNEIRTTGRYTMDFTARGIASGVYFYRLEAGDPSASSGQSFVQTKRMVLIK